MNRIQLILLAVFALLFIATAIWKNSSAIVNEPDRVGKEEVDKIAVREFWLHYNKALEFMNEGYYDSSAAHFEKALRLNPRHDGTLYNLGNSRLMLREFEQAGDHWRRLAELKSNSARARLQLGTLHFCMDENNPLFDPEEAKTFFKQAHNMNREETGPPLNIAKIAILKNQTSDAEEYINKILAANRKNRQALFLKGYLEWKTSRTGAADSFLTESFNLYNQITKANMEGEGATATGLSPMLSEDLFCDFFGLRIEQLMTGRGNPPSSELYYQFDRSVADWTKNYDTN